MKSTVATIKSLVRMRERMCWRLGAVWHLASSFVRWSSEIASTMASAEATWDRKGGSLCPSWLAAHSLISSSVHPSDRFEGLPELDRSTFYMLGVGLQATCAVNMMRNVKDKSGTQSEGKPGPKSLTWPRVKPRIPSRGETLGRGQHTKKRFSNSASNEGGKMRVERCDDA